MLLFLSPLFMLLFLSSMLLFLSSSSFLLSAMSASRARAGRGGRQGRPRGYEEGPGGGACQRFGCLYDCSGHGQCVSMKKMATMPNALPLSKPATYTGLETTERWDQDRIYGCVCDSSWPVGLGPGQRQEPEWFGPWCSLRHCPSGDDPYTTHVDETNCTGVTAAGGYGVGEKGNLCQVDCANRGKCDDP